MDSSDKAIARTLLYSDIFDYPLTQEQIWKYLISEKKIKKSVFENKVSNINSIVFNDKGYFYLKNKNKIVLKRTRKIKESRRKMELALGVCEKLFSIPTVLFIGVSGNLSMLNADKKDDIDLFVITKKNTVWITRLLLVFYLKILGKYRGRNDKNVKDKFCLNMLLDESKLTFSNDQRNLYTAHEIAQVKPVLQRKNIYKKFLKKNGWIKEFMPNIEENIKIKKYKELKSLKARIIKKILTFSLIESLAKITQKLKMRKNLTREVIQDGFIALHPRDYKKYVLAQYQKRIVKYGL